MLPETTRALRYNKASALAGQDLREDAGSLAKLAPCNVEREAIWAGPQQGGESKQLHRHRERDGLRMRWW